MQLVNGIIIHKNNYYGRIPTPSQLPYIYCFWQSLLVIAPNNHVTKWWKRNITCPFSSFPSSLIGKMHANAYGINSPSSSTTTLPHSFIVLLAVKNKLTARDALCRSTTRQPYSIFLFTNNNIPSFCRSTAASKFLLSSLQYASISHTINPLCSVCPTEIPSLTLTYLFDSGATRYPLD